MAFGETPIDKGALIRIEDGQMVDALFFQFNPTDLAIKNSVEYAGSDHPGQFMPVLRFKQVNKREITFNLRFNGREGQLDVGEELARIELFTIPGSRLTASSPLFVPPPSAVLVFGEQTYHGVVTTADVIQRMFGRSLQVVEAEVAVTFAVGSQGPADDMAFANRIRTRAGF